MSDVERKKHTQLQAPAQLQEKGKLCDLTLRSKDGLEIKVHKLVMNSVSGFFRDLFSSDFKENSENIVQLDVSTGDILEKVVCFVYQGNLKAEKVEDFLELAKVAKYLQIEALSEECLIHLEKLITDRTCLNCWKLAKNYLIEKVDEMCISHILSSAQRLFQDSSFVNDLSLDEMKTLLKDSRLTCTQEIIFKTIKKWVENNTSTTDDFLKLFSDLVDYVQFSSLSAEFLLTNVFQNDVLMGDRKVLTKLIEDIRDKFEENEYQNPKKPKLTSEWKKQFLAIRGTDVLSISNSEEKMEIFHKNCHLFRDFGYTTFGNNFLLACGGVNDSDEAQNICQYFSPITKEWATIKPMRSARRGHRCACIDGKIYACGGVLNRVGASVEIFDLNTEMWTTGPKMLVDGGSFGLTSINGLFYAVRTSGSAEMLDPRRGNTWSSFSFNSNFYTITQCVQCVSIGYDIYCFNNQGQTWICDSRENKTRQWELCRLSNNWNCFHVCKLDAEIGIFFPKSSELFKLNLEGEITMSCALPNDSSQSDDIGALVALYH